MVGRSIPTAVVTSVVLLASMLAGGVVGFHLVADYPWGDALYMTVITVSTVGYGEIHPLNAGGRVVAAVLIVSGVGTFFYVLTNMVQLATGGALRRAFEERHMKNEIHHLTGHYVICGFGRVGEETAAEFRSRDADFVTIESDPERARLAREQGLLVVEGDATEDETLREARVPYARGLVAASGVDAQNTYIILSARAMNPSLIIVARASHHDAEAKMRRAGANHVISPYTIGGRRMALSALQPLMVDFMDMVVTAREGERILAELEVQPDSVLAGQTLSDACAGTGLVVLGLRRADGTFIVGPGGQVSLAGGDHLILLGAPGDIEQFAPTAAPAALQAGS